MHHRLAAVGFGAAAIGEERHDVARAEIGCAEIGILANDVRGSGTYMEVVDDISRLLLLLQRVVPPGSRPAVLLALVANLGEDELALHKLHHGLMISQFERRSRVQGRKSAVDVNRRVVSPQLAGRVVLVQVLCLERLENAESVVVIVNLAPYQLVAQAKRTIEQFGCRVGVKQRLLIFGVEQEGAYLVVGDIVVVVEQGAIEQQLHKVGRGLARRDESPFAWHIVSLARLLLYQYVAVGLQEVNTSLKTEHLASE